MKYRAGRRFRGITMPTERFRRGAVRANRMANDSAIRTKYYRVLLFLNTFGGGFLTESAPSNLTLFAELDKICLWKMSKIEGFCQQQALESILQLNYVKCLISRFLRYITLSITLGTSTRRFLYLKNYFRQTMQTI